MSIAKMISTHPDVRGAFNERLARAVHHADLCALICPPRADACLANSEAPLASLG